MHYKAKIARFIDWLKYSNNKNFHNSVCPTKWVLTRSSILVT